MREDFKKLFSLTIPPEPPHGLFEKITNRIQKEQKMVSVRRHAFVFALSALCSAVALVPIFQITQSGMKESGFMQFFSLLFSDFGIITANWQGYILTILETIPIMKFVALLAIILVFLESLKILTRDIKIISHSKNNNATI